MQPRLSPFLSQFAPRSLLWRAFVLIAILMLLSVAAWFAIFSTYEREPRARQLAQTLVSVANLTRVTLVSARVEARRSVLRELSDREGIHIFPAEAGDRIEPLPDDPFLERVEQLVRAALGSQTRLTLKRNDENGLFVTLRIEDDVDDVEFWVALPRERIERRFPIDWLGWGFAVVLLSLLGAWMIVLHISQPLRHLALAARKIGAGQTPPVLPEDGPEEIAAVSGAFNQMHRDLAQLDQDRALVLAGISHDLRTPLTRLRMGIEMTGDDCMREGMSADVEEMDKTITQFLDFARTDAGESTAMVDLAKLLDELAVNYRRRRIDVRFAPGATMEIRARPQAVRRAVSNLIDNAARYAPGSPIDLELTTTARFARIAVLDRGPGIPAAEFERVKRPFTRLEAARSNVTGAGLGLAIVERIARSHGGRLELREREGGGLAALLSFPK